MLDFSQAKSAARKRSFTLIAVGTSGILLLVLWFITLSTFRSNDDEIRAVETTSVNRDSEKILEDCQNSLSSSTQCISRREALAVWADVDEVISTLGRKHVEKWGNNEFVTLSEEFTAAKLLFETNQFQSALERFQFVLKSFEELDLSSISILEDTINRGWQAIDEERAAIALESFELALQINSENPAANSGQRRALVLEDVLDLYVRGTIAEQEGNLEAALRLFEQALQMDSDFNKAVSAVQSVRQKITARNYRNSISTALIFLENGDLAAAKKAFESALTFRPVSQEALNGLSQTVILIERQTIGSNLALAIQAHEQENWEEASHLYGQVLSMDSTVKPAMEGKKIVDQMMGLESEITGLLERQYRLSSAAVFDYAEDIVAEAEHSFGSSPRLSEHAKELKLAMVAMKVPVRLIVRSDRKTNINIQRVGELGSFDEQILNILPGRYVVTGSRRGFRNKRMEIDVLPRSDLRIVTMICDEPIR